jgi:transcriptional regulator with XRE-family HTH domain
MSWFQPDNQERRLLVQERLLLEASEAVCRALDDRGVSRSDLAKLLSVRASEVTQRLSGGRNLTLRTLAEMLDVLGYDVHLSLVDRGAGSRLRSSA